MFVDVSVLVYIMAARLRRCMICGLSDGHTLIDCPYKCKFCAESVQVCNRANSSLVDSILDAETPEKDMKMSKRRAKTDGK